MKYKMQYRYFATSIDITKEQFIKNYGEHQVIVAETQDEFMQIVMYPVLKTVIILDSFLFFDLLTENNIYHLSKLENYFKYIVFSGNNLEELCKRIQTHKETHKDKDSYKTRKTYKSRKLI
jgi:hypothetical protein